MTDDRLPTRWPAPYLQPDPHTGCMEHAAAYVARSLGHPEVTAEQVKQWREERRYSENMYPTYALGHAIERFWMASNQGDEEESKRFWLGTGTRSWVEAHLAAGQIALVLVHRIPTMAHAVVLLESAGDEGALIMDPLYGYRVESWEWFLGIGPGTHGCHHIDGWYSPEIDPTVMRML